MTENTPRVVITRKDKRLHKFWHLFAFTATGGASAPVTAARAATNAGYNARTRKLASAPVPAEGFSERYLDRSAQRHEANVAAREELGIPQGVPFRKLPREQRRALRLRTRALPR